MAQIILPLIWNDDVKCRRNEQQKPRKQRRVDGMTLRRRAAAVAAAATATAATAVVSRRWRDYFVSANEKALYTRRVKIMMSHRLAAEVGKSLENVVARC